MTKVFPIVVDLDNTATGIAEACSSSLKERDEYIEQKIAASSPGRQENVVDLVVRDLDDGVLSGGLLLTLAVVGMISLIDRQKMMGFAETMLRAIIEDKPKEGSDGETGV